MPQSDHVSRAPPDGAEGFRDHDAAMRDALPRVSPPTRLERHLHIGSHSRGPKSARAPIEAFSPALIEPDCAGMSHRGAQHLANGSNGGFRDRRRLKPATPNPVRRYDIEGAPVGRCANARWREMRTARFPPRHRSNRMHADGDVEIEPDRCRAGARAPCRRQADGRVPLHESDERGLRRPSAPLRKREHLPSSGVRHFSGHSHQGVLNCAGGKQTNPPTPSNGKADRQARALVRNFSKTCRLPASDRP